MLSSPRKQDGHAAGFVEATNGNPGADFDGSSCTRGSDSSNWSAPNALTFGLMPCARQEAASVTSLRTIWLHWGAHHSDLTTRQKDPTASMQTRDVHRWVFMLQNKGVRKFTSDRTIKDAPLCPARQCTARQTAPRSGTILHAQHPAPA